MNRTKIRVALVVGDPCGIGPELVVKLLAEPQTVKKADIVVIADSGVIGSAEILVGKNIQARPVESIAVETDWSDGCLLLDRPRLDSSGTNMGKVSLPSGRFQLDCLVAGLELCQAGMVDGMCFAPLNKEALKLAGLKYEDESGFFIEKLGHTGEFGLLNTLGNLWTSRATSHVSHRQVSEFLTTESVLTATRLLHRAVKASGKKEPKIAVAGLNPHAGDGGMFGNEETDIIKPAVAMAKQEGIHADGPFPADTIFLKGRDGEYDGIVTMYHDQGQIAMKLLGFDHGVTVHAGLPFPVTTSAHGSAFNIAGRGVANVNAMRAAFDLACSMAKSR
jgi:4-hydroxythreonine-4-phosphate dehydrogenase